MRLLYDRRRPLPRGWIAGATGLGAAAWAVEAGDTAPTRPHVLKQSGAAPFTWCVKQGASLRDGFVEVSGGWQSRV